MYKKPDQKDGKRILNLESAYWMLQNVTNRYEPL
jgi:hypothetical protein